MEKAEFSLTLGKKIKQKRMAMGISQAELALRCGKDRQHMELIENGKTNCTSYTLFLICENLELSFWEFFNDTK